MQKLEICLECYVFVHLEELVKTGAFQVLFS